MRFVPELKILGVGFDRQLSFLPHLKSLKTKISKNFPSLGNLLWCLLGNFLRSLQFDPADIASPFDFWTTHPANRIIIPVGSPTSNLPDFRIYYMDGSCVCPETGGESASIGAAFVVLSWHSNTYRAPKKILSSYSCYCL